MNECACGKHRWMPTLGRWATITESGPVRVTGGNDRDAPPCTGAVATAQTQMAAYGGLRRFRDMQRGQR